MSQREENDDGAAAATTTSAEEESLEDNNQDSLSDTLKNANFNADDDDENNKEFGKDEKSHASTDNEVEQKKPHAEVLDVEQVEDEEEDEQFPAETAEDLKRSIQSGVSQFCTSKEESPGSKKSSKASEKRVSIAPITERPSPSTASKLSKRSKTSIRSTDSKRKDKGFLEERLSSLTYVTASTESIAASIKEKKKLKSALQKLHATGPDLSQISMVSSYYSTASHLKAVKYANTYQLGPRAKFLPSEVYFILKYLNERTLQKMEVYNSNLASAICQDHAKELRSGAVNKHFDRYKISAVVLIGEKLLHGVHITARCLWDQERDSWVSCLTETPNFFVLSACFGLYHD